MEQILNPEIAVEPRIEYATFWSRAGAYILDGIIVAAVTLSINAINIINFKSFLIYLPVAVIAILYKPYMEANYGATLGKIALNLKVTDQNFKRIALSRSFLRSLIFIFPALLYLPIYYFAFSNPVLEESSGYIEFSQLLIMEYPTQNWIGNITFLIILIDMVLLLTDPTKTQRSWHDRIAKTFVVKDKI